MISLNEPTVGKKELKHINFTIKKKWISSYGGYNKKFENILSRILKCKNVIAVSSGTAALHLALKVLNVKENDEVIVPSLTFIATINAIKYVNASPIFMDVGNDHNLDIDKTIEFLEKKTFIKNKSTYNLKTKKKISALIVVHLWGNAINFERLKTVCKKRNIFIIEDATEALGTTYINKQRKIKHVGTIGDIGCLSFNGNKIITTGSGGAVISNNSKLAKKTLYYAEQAKDDNVRYIHNEIGYNYRLPNLNAAFGYAQILKLDQILKKKKIIHKFYKHKIEKINGLSLLKPVNYSRSNFWMNILIIDSIKIKISPIKFHKKLLAKGVQTRLIWKPNHLQKKYKKMQNYKIINSNKLYNSCLCIPSSFDLNSKQLNKICLLIKKIAKKKLRH